MSEADSHVLRWINEDPDEHPVIAELRARPNEWAVICELDSGDLGALTACKAHPDVETAMDGDWNANINSLEVVRTRARFRRGRDV